MPQPSSRRLASIALACLLAGSAVASAPTASALALDARAPAAVPTSLVDPGAGSGGPETETNRGASTYSDALVGGDVLAGGEQISSGDGGYSFVMQTDGNAVIYTSSGRPTWSTGTAGTGDRLVMQGDGNAVVYSSGGQPVWSSGTEGAPGAILVIENSGDLVVERSDGSRAWSSSDGLVPPAVSDTLSAGGGLEADQQLVSSDGGTRASLQGDGNFVVYGRAGALFSTRTSGSGNRLVMQGDGNAVVYSATGAPLWASGTSGNPGAKMVVQNDGNLVIYATDGRALWASASAAAPAAGDVLSSGRELRSGQQLTSSDGGSRAVMQGDGNFVVYSGGSARWSSGTSGAGNRVTMQSDGNAVVYSASGRALWQSATGGRGDARMVMQNDGNLVIYSTSGPALWASASSPSSAPTPPNSGSGRDLLSAGNNLYGGDDLVGGDFRASMQRDGVFAVYGAGSRLRWSAGVSGAGNYLAMQTDGNAVIYSASGSPRWQSGTAGNPGARMIMQSDGNLVVYSADGRRALWQSGTARPASPGDSRNCGDFRSQAEAQGWYETYFLDYGDIAVLDGNNDGRACESYRY